MSAVADTVLAMISHVPSPYGDDTCSGAVVVDRTVYLGHHGGGFERDDPAHQARAALDAVRATMEQVGGAVTDVVQLHLYLRDLTDLRAACDVFGEYFGDRPPARMTSTTDFFDPRCRVMVEGIAALPQHAGAQPA